uniref:glucuronosyltransferase n=1 Tax=Bursaphelenchus xylophilus TaxID=6326 RepID=A0A1I7SCY0_BURXY
MGKIADVLVDAGHNVTFYQQDAFTSIIKTGTKKARVIRRPCTLGCREQPSGDMWKLTDVIEGYKVYGKTMALACESQLKDNSLTDMLRVQNFKLVIAESFDYCAFALAEKAGIKRFIAASATMIHPLLLTTFGNPNNIVVTPGLDDDHGSQMSFFQRAKAFLFFPIKKWFTWKAFQEGLVTAIRTHYRNDFESAQITAQSSYVFVNIDEHLAFQQPLSAKFIYVGGEVDGTKNIKSLPENVDKIVKNSKYGVILISFGTIAQSYLLPEHTKQELVKTFEKFSKYDFIWKYEADDKIAANLTNVHKMKWTPQAELLAHPNLVAFVTHGGINSVSEAAQNGKPFVCIPIFGDQSHNCFAAQEKGLAVLVAKTDITTENMETALRTVLEPAFQTHAQTFARMMAKKPFKPRDRIVGYVNQALEFDVSSVLDLPGRKLSIIEYYFIDVILVFAACVLLLVYAFRKIMSAVIAQIMRPARVKVE